MHEYRAHFQDEHGHPDIAIWLDEELKSNVAWLIRYFESAVNLGTVYRNDETIQIGWMIAILRNDAEGRLAIWEPRFDAMPIQWIKRANNTLRHLVIQREVCAQLNVEPVFPSIRQSAVVSPSFLQGSDSFTMSRDHPNGQDSGWVLTELGYSDASANLCSLFEIGLNRPSAIPFVALPDGATVRRTEAEIEITYGGAEISSRSNGFLQRLFSVDFSASRA